MTTTPALTPPTPTPPAPGEPRPCKACGVSFTPGHAGGYDGHCGRCNGIRRAGGTPGPRIRQPRGEARVPVKGNVRPALKKLITDDMLAAFRVRSESELVELALARLLGRPDLEPTKTGETT